VSTARIITDPDEAEELFKAGLLMWYDYYGTEPLNQRWTVGSIRRAADHCPFCVIEEG
jgi:hypothetical protein